MTLETQAIRPVPFREVRHDQPDDCVHYEPVATRFAAMNWTIPMHCHEGLHQLQYLTKGSVQGRIDDRQVSGCAPVFFLMAPGSMHGFQYSHDAVGHQLTLPSATLARWLAQTPVLEQWLNGSFMLHPCAVQAERWRIGFEQIAEEFESAHPGRVQTLCALTTLMAVQAGRLYGAQAVGEKRYDTRDALARRFKALVELHYGKHWPLSDYAALLGVGQDHLSRACRKAWGLGALTVLNDRLLLQARRLLAYTPLSVSEIAEQLGYADSAYFSRVFRRGVGRTPSEYRVLAEQGIHSAD